jgi:flagellar motor protein MotB
LYSYYSSPMQKGAKGTFVMRIVAGFICAFLLFLGAPCHAADDTPSTVRKPAARSKSAAKEKSPAKAKKNYAISLSPMAGEYLFDSKDKLKSGQIYGLKLSYNIIGTQMLDSLGIDAIAGYIDTTSTTDNSKAKVYHFRLDATYPFIFKNSKFTPFLAVGAGGNFYERSDATSGKALFGYGGGLKYKILDYLAVRADARHIILFTPERFNNVEFTGGLTYTFGVERKPSQKELEKLKKEKEKIELEKKEKERIEKEKKEKGKSGEKEDKQDKTEIPAKTPEKVEEAPAKAKTATNGAKEPVVETPEAERKAAEKESVKGADVPAPSASVATSPGTVQTAALQSAATAEKETIYLAPVKSPSASQNGKVAVAVEKKAAAVESQPVEWTPKKVLPEVNKPEPAATREVSSTSKAAPTVAAAEAKGTATAPAGETAKEKSAPAAGPASAPAAPVPATTPVKAGSLSAEKGSVEAAAEPTGQPSFGKALPEKKKQLPAERRNVPPESRAAMSPGGRAALTAITMADDGVEIRTSAPVGTFRYFRLSKPARLVIDLPGLINGTREKTFSLGSLGFAGARVSIHRGKLRVVLDADRGTFPPFQVKKTDSGIKVTSLETGEKAGVSASRRDVGKAPAPVTQPGETIVPAPVTSPAGGAVSGSAVMEKGKQEYLLTFNVEFDTAKVSINPRYYGLLGKAADFLKSNPGTFAEIKGHADSIGSARYNLLLSQKRAAWSRNTS